MLRTHLCDLLGIEYPVIQAPVGSSTNAELVAAVSNAGGLGSLAIGLRPAEDFKRELARLPKLTARPFAVNHAVVLLDEELFGLTLQAKPAVISFATNDPGDLVERAHAAGSRVVHQIHTVKQAVQAAERGVDVIVAQGAEAGGEHGTVGALALIPQVVAAVSPIPVVAAGGIADGRGLAAALVLGAQGVQMGTRFLASAEAPIGEGWKRAILAAESEDAVDTELLHDIAPRHGGGGYELLTRVLRTPFLDKWRGRREEARREAEHLRQELRTARQQGREHEFLPWAGQSAGAIREILPAAEIVRRVIRQAQEALAQVSAVRT